MKFKALIWRYYRAHGRHDLPWRPPTLKLRRGKENDFVYKILVSEVMLQQTQVERVLSFYAEFTRRFPTAAKLAKASLADVLKAWQGLGHNRRALLLREAARKLADTPLSDTRLNLVKELEELPGVGPYTARAVAVFAFNRDVILVETNIRTAVIHHFFADKKPYSAKATKGKKVSDKEIEKILKQVLPRGNAREWYSALMDYGAHLKRSGVRLNARRRHYAKQSKFTGSLREARGAVLRALALGERTRSSLVNLFGPARRVQTRAALQALQAEGLICVKKNRYALSD